MNLLITGGCGFLGTNLGLEAIRRGYRLTVVDNLSRMGGKRNLELLESSGSFTFHEADLRNFADVEAIFRDVRPDAVFHLSGQVAMTTSIASPRDDFEINVLGGHNVLESLRRHSPEGIILFSSTNKVYGSMLGVDIEERDTRYVAPAHPNGFSEDIPLCFESPYGCSKGAIDQYMLDYDRIFGLRSVVFRHSSIYGSRQFSTADQGWVGWFVQQALLQSQGNKDSFTIAGNGKQVRDLLCAPDLVTCYFGALEQIETAHGRAYNIGGGMENSFSLLELFAFLEAELGVKLHYEQLQPRQSDQQVFVADTGLAHQKFGWSPRISREDGVRDMITWVTKVQQETV